MASPRFVDGIGAFADRYHGFVLDQWGVIHDGHHALPAAAAAIAELKRRGKRLVLLSNSGRRADLNRRRLVAMGFDLAMFEAVVTSGETAWRQLKDRPGPPFTELGRKCVLLTIGGDVGVVEGLGLELVERPEAADFLFVTGLESPPEPLEAYRPLLSRAAARGLPMLCSNPDRVAPVLGELVLAPGSLAALYQDLKGVVHYVGKPHRAIYDVCLEALSGLSLEKVVAIGNSMEHDIVGANAAGIASCFLTAGIHAAMFAPGEPPENGVAELAARYGARPDWVTQALTW